MQLTGAWTQGPGTQRARRLCGDGRSAELQHPPHTSGFHSCRFAADTDFPPESGFYVFSIRPRSLVLQGQVNTTFGCQSEDWSTLSWSNQVTDWWPWRDWWNTQFCNKVERSYIQYISNALQRLPVEIELGDGQNTEVSPLIIFSLRSNRPCVDELFSLNTCRVRVGSKIAQSC